MRSQCPASHLLIITSSICVDVIWNNTVILVIFILFTFTVRLIEAFRREEEKTVLENQMSLLELSSSYGFVTALTFGFTPTPIIPLQCSLHLFFKRLTESAFCKFNLNMCTSEAAGVCASESALLFRAAECLILTLSPAGLLLISWK